MDERFALLSEQVSELAGRWQHTAFWFLMFVLWAALGFVVHFSDSWQLWGNTPTTWVELFLGLMCLSAANRVEKAMLDLLKEIRATVKTEARQIEQIEEAVAPDVPEN